MISWVISSIHTAVLSQSKSESVMDIMIRNGFHNVKYDQVGNDSANSIESGDHGKISNIKKSGFNVVKPIPGSIDDIIHEDTDAVNPVKGGINDKIHDKNKKMFGLHVVYPFPGSIDDELYEQIQHPAAKYYNEKGKRKLKKFIKVPRFWNPKQIYVNGMPVENKTNMDLRDLLVGKERGLMSAHDAQSIGSSIYASPESGQKLLLETIYVSVASYRDYQCAQTVESIFSMAKHPERIRVAIVDQMDRSKGDLPCFDVSINCVNDGVNNHDSRDGKKNPDKTMNKNKSTFSCKHSDQIEYYEIDAQLSVGPVFARHLAHRMYRGEYFAAQIDAHVDFVKDWDMDIISQWKSAGNDMAILSTYLSDISESIDANGNSMRHGRPIMCKTDFEGWGKAKHLRHGQQPEGTANIKGEPSLEPFWAAGFSFARGHFVVNVPYDQHLPQIFQGEETSIGVRAFTYGYDFYTPERSVCFHYYKRKKSVNLFWENDSLYERDLEGNAMARLNGIIKLTFNDKGDWDHTDEEKYGIGSVRTTKKFYETFGIDIKKKHVENHLCQFAGKNMQLAFKQYLRENGMGIDYDRISFKFLDPDIHGRTWEKYLPKDKEN